MKRISSYFIVIFAATGFSSASAQQDISPGAIASSISLDSGNPADAYQDYSISLATTLGYLTLAQLERVFKGPVSQGLPPTPPTLNEQLNLDPINFQPKSLVLTAGAKAELDKVAQFLKDNPDLKIRIEGHINFKKVLQTSALSQGRADASLLYLMEQGIDSNRIESVSKGSSEPLLDENGNPMEGEVNRRIEIEIIE